MGSTTLDVLIIGAGPAGMTLAAALRPHGLSVRIIDKDEGPITVTRAPVLWQRTQEILAALGIRDRWSSESHEFLDESLHFYGTASGHVSTVAPASPYPRALIVGQDVTERILAQRLGEVGTAVEYGLEATGFEDGLEAAVVTVEDRDGRVDRMAARWVVASEGSKSVVRRAVGLDFEGERYTGYRIHVADVRARWVYPTPVGQAFFFVLEHGYLGGQRLPGHPDRFYFYMLTPDERPEDDSNALSLDEAQSLLRRLSGDDGAILSDPIWLNSARYRHGYADAYRKGRAILVGDTARVAPPLYGQGMNYAIHDAWNLAWKLAFVAKGFGPDALLDTYSDERRKLGADLDARIDRTFRSITRPKPLQAPVLRRVMPLLLSSESVREKFGENFHEIELDYTGIGLSEKPTSLGRLKAGMRAPAVWVKRLPDCTLANLLDLYDGTAWVLLVFGREGTDETGALVDRALTLAAAYADRLRAVLLSEGVKRPDPLRLETVVDAESRFVDEHGLPDSGTMLVRPDGYIAFLARTPTEALDAYLRRWLRPS